MVRLLEQRFEEAAFASRAAEPVQYRTRQKKKKKDMRKGEKPVASCGVG